MTIASAFHHLDAMGRWKIRRNPDAGTWHIISPPFESDEWGGFRRFALPPFPTFENARLTFSTLSAFAAQPTQVKAPAAHTAEATPTTTEGMQ
jgi:hypothetical protein